MPGSRSIAVLFVAIAQLGLVSCAPKKLGDRKETIPVTGIISVDGKPVEGLRVICKDVAGIDPVRPSVSQCFTDKDGKFAISTYEAGDGVPPGDYQLTYLWGQFNMNMQYGGPDKLNDRYSDPSKSAQKFPVAPGSKPIDLGKIDLTTK